MIYTDRIHLVSDSKDIVELHRFALRIGLKRHWFHPGRIPHYDLKPERMIQIAIDAGAKEISSRELIEIMRRR